MILSELRNEGITRLHETMFKSMPEDSLATIDVLQVCPLC